MLEPGCLPSVFLCFFDQFSKSLSLESRFPFLCYYSGNRLLPSHFPESRAQMEASDCTKCLWPFPRLGSLWLCLLIIIQELNHLGSVCRVPGWHCRYLPT